MRSSYLVLDITNPEKPPTLLAEINDPKLGFTLSNVDIIKAVNSTEGHNTSQWYLTFTSGPTGEQAISNNKSTQNAQLFVYDLNSLTNQSIKTRHSAALAVYDTGDQHSYGGDLLSVDLDHDYIDDAVYFGTVQTNHFNHQLSGKFKRAVMTFNNKKDNHTSIKVKTVNINTFLNTDRAITAPLHARSQDGADWLYLVLDDHK